MPGITHFYFDGEELTAKTAQKLVELKLWGSYYQCLWPDRSNAGSVCSITDEMLATSSARLAIPRRITNRWNGQNCQMVSMKLLLWTSRIQGLPSTISEKTAGSLNLKGYQLIIQATMTDEGLLLYGYFKDFQLKFNGYRIELEDVSQNSINPSISRHAVAVPRYNKGITRFRTIVWSGARKRTKTRCA